MMILIVLIYLHLKDDTHRFFCVWKFCGSIWGVYHTKCSTDDPTVCHLYVTLYVTVCHLYVTRLMFCAADTPNGVVKISDTKKSINMILTVNINDYYVNHCISWRSARFFVKNYHSVLWYRLCLRAWIDFSKLETQKIYKRLMRYKS